MAENNNSPFYFKNFMVFPREESLEGISIRKSKSKKDKPKKYPVWTFDNFQMPNIWRYTLEVWWHKEYVESYCLPTEEQFKIMWQRKSLYLLDNSYECKYRYNLPKNDRFLLLVDDFISYLEARKIILDNRYQKVYVYETHQYLKNLLWTLRAVKTSRILLKKLKISFMFVMMELHKMIEENDDFRSFLDENISMEWCCYYKEYKWKYKVHEYVWTITKQIEHLGEECAFWATEKLLKGPTTMERKVKLRNYTLPVEIKEIKNVDLCFSIENSNLESKKMEQIIKYTFDYFYLKPEFVEKEVKKNDKKYDLFVD